MQDFNAASTAESHYMTASPFTDTFDVLLPMNITNQALSQYRVLLITGDLEPNSSLPGLVEEFVATGGVVVLTNTVAGLSTNATLVGATFGGVESVAAQALRDVETGWVRNVTVQAPFCVKAANSGFYIKVGGDPRVTAGWDGGHTDKCCRSGPGNCRWFNSGPACLAALARLPVSCTSCITDPGPLGCPAWAWVAKNVSIVTLSSMAMGASTLLELQVQSRSAAAAAEKLERTVPAAIIHRWPGGGAVVTLLLPVADDMARFQLLDHVLARIQNDTAMVTVTDPVTGASLLSQA